MDKGNAVSEALRELLAMVEGADAQEMVGRRKPKAVAIEVEAEPAGCEACAKGECMDPEHASEDDLSAMMGEG